MIKLEIISVRKMDKSPVPQFFNSDKGIKEHIEKKFKETNKLVSASSSVNEDYSTETKILIFGSQEDYFEFTNDEVLQYQNRLQDRYNKYYSITTNRSISII
jgi:hypothetical protein